MIKEIEKAVANIEQEIFDSTEGVEYFNVSLYSNGFEIGVKFIGITIWSSEDDMRNDINDNGDKEDIEVYLRRAIKSELLKLSKISI